MLKTIKKFLGLLGLGACCLTLAPSGAAAHGEKALEPFIRMRTIQWYDVQWSREKLNVNDELVITGKFHVAEDWPRGVPKPDATYLNVSSPGPVFIRTERYLNGQSSVSSAALKLGGDYDFKIVLKARLPGRYHLHPFFNLHDAGAVMGPGHWFEVAGDPAAFTNQVKTLNGDMIDMESYGLANGVAWHAFWIALGSARYDIVNDKFDQARLGLGYVDDCFMLSLNWLTGYTYVGTTSPHQSNSFMMEFSLRTLGPDVLSAVAPGL